jgi:Ca2+-binding EF-hand superfamily protein
MLQRFQSVHDAFQHFEKDFVRRSLTRDEFATALGRLGFPAGEAAMIFVSMDVDRLGGLSLAEFHEALVNVSADALLWELRCRLDSQGVRPSNLQMVFELLDIPWPARTGCGGSPGARGKPRLEHTAWLQFCAKLGLTSKDGERLFALIDTDSDGFIDLREMFRALRVVAPDTSFEGFVSQIFTEYGSLHEAFAMHAKDGLMSNFEFMDLASTLDVNEDNITKLWQARWFGNVAPDTLDEDAPLDEETFVHLMMKWAPDSSVQGLQADLRKNALCGVATSAKSGAATGYGSIVRRGRSTRSGAGRKLPRRLVLESPLL